MFVMEAGELPVGQVRFDVKRDVACVDYSLEAVVRGRNWDSAANQTRGDRFHGSHPGRLRMMDDSLPSA